MARFNPTLKINFDTSGSPPPQSIPDDNPANRAMLRMKLEGMLRPWMWSRLLKGPRRGISKLEGLILFLLICMFIQNNLRVSMVLMVCMDILPCHKARLVRLT